MTILAKVYLTEFRIYVIFRNKINNKLFNNKLYDKVLAYTR